jgi:hypothetical protein
VRRIRRYFTGDKANEVAPKYKFHLDASFAHVFCYSLNLRREAKPQIEIERCYTYICSSLEIQQSSTFCKIPIVAKMLAQSHIGFIFGLLNAKEVNCFLDF